MKITSKNMTEYKQHIRVHISDCRRNFQFNRYGSKNLTVLAATAFEKYAMRVLNDFDASGRLPNQRKAALDAHGLGTEYNKKPIRVQRAALCLSLSQGESTVMEKEIVENAWTKYHSSEVLKQTSVGYSNSNSQFVVEFTGAKLKLQQSFKSLQRAADWAMGMNVADKDYWAWENFGRAFAIRICQ